MFIIYSLIIVIVIISENESKVQKKNNMVK